MPIQVNCGCGKQLQVPEIHAGKRIKCTACGETQTVPSAGPGAKQNGAIKAARPAEVVTAELVGPALLSCDCEACGRTLKARPEQAGKKFKCPHCGAAVLIAYPEVEAAEEVEEVEEVEEQPRRRAAAPSRIAVGMPPKSRKPILVSDDDVVVDDEEDEEEDERPRLGKQGRKRKSEGSGSQTMLWVGIGGGVAVLLGGVVFALVYFLSGGDSKTASAKNSNSTTSANNTPAPGNPKPGLPGMPGGANPPAAVANNPPPNNPAPNPPAPNPAPPNNPVVPPVPNVPAVALTGEKALLATDAAGLAVFHVSALAKTPFGQELSKKLMADQSTATTLAEMEKAGLSLANIDHAGVVLKNGTEMEPSWVYVTTHNPLDQNKILQDPKTKPVAKTHKGATYYVDSNRGNATALHFASATMVVIAKNEEMMQEAIDRLAGRQISLGNAMASAIEQVDKHQIVIGFTAPPQLKEMAQAMAGGGQAPNGPGFPGGQGAPGGQGRPGAQGPGVQPGRPETPGRRNKPGGAGMQPGRPGMQPGGPGMQPGRPGMQPGGPGMQPGGPGMQPGGPGMQPGGPGMQPGGPGRPGAPGMQPGVLDYVGKLIEIVNGIVVVDVNGTTISMETTGIFPDEPTASQAKIDMEQVKQLGNALLLGLATQGQAPPKQVTDALQNATIGQSGTQVVLKATLDLPLDVLQKAFAQQGMQENGPGNPGFPQNPGFPNPRGPNPRGPNPGFPPNPGGTNPAFPGPGAPMPRK